MGGTRIDIVGPLPSAESNSLTYRVALRLHSLIQLNSAYRIDQFL